MEIQMMREVVVTWIFNRGGDGDTDEEGSGISDIDERGSGSGESTEEDEEGRSTRQCRGGRIASGYGVPSRA